MSKVFYYLRKTGYIFILDLLILACCALGVYRFALKADFPARIERKGSVLIVKEAFSRQNASFLVGDTLVAIEGQIFRSNDEIAFFCDQYRIGDSLTVDCIRNAKTIRLSIPLSKFYTTSQIIIESAVALIFLFIGIAVLFLQRKEKSTRVFHHLCVSIAAVIFLTSGSNAALPMSLGYILELLFQSFFVLIPVFFIHFTLIFPGKDLTHRKNFLQALYCIAVVLMVWFGFGFLTASYPHVDMQRYDVYNTANYAARLFFAFSFFGGFGNIIRSYRMSKDDIERRKLRWIFLGIIFGASSYIFLWLVPDLVIGKGLFDEEIPLGLSVVAPISFAIAILRYRVFDIDLILERSTVYTIVIGALLAVYVGIVALFSEVAGAVVSTSLAFNTIGALLIALLFEPLRKRVQRIVDKKFFRVSYNFYEAQREILEEIKFANSEQRLAECVVRRTDAILAVERLAFFTVEYPTERMKLVAHNGFDILERRGVRLEREQLKTTLDLPVALDTAIEAGVPFEKADKMVFNRWGIALVLPMLSDERRVLGFLVIGQKRSGTRFTIEDISLLNSVSIQSALALSRIVSERKLILEQEESERLSELNQLKSYFVSSVSHDLKTPLTSIRMFAEIMKDQKNLPQEKVREYLEIIEGEADRLSRLITNVLDYAKIEKGAKEYVMIPVDLNVLAREVLHSLEYQIHSRGFTLHSHIDNEPLIIKADRDAVFDAITNIITNAMKYSPPDRQVITLRTSFEDGNATIAIEDQGYGIPVHEREAIFESFYRIAESHMKSAGGAGLGLSLVKHTMDAHHGKIEVRSEVGKGSIFVLYFPIDPHEENSHY